MTKDQIISEALSLDPSERDEVAEALWRHPAQGEFTREQLIEIRRRVEGIDSGEVQLLPGEHVMAELRARFQR